MHSIKLSFLSSPQLQRLPISPVLRAHRFARKLSCTAMAANTSVPLDKNTPDNVWKEVLSTEQVLSYQLFMSEACSLCLVSVRRCQILGIRLLHSEEFRSVSDRKEFAICHVNQSSASCRLCCACPAASVSRSRGFVVVIRLFSVSRL
jgi:hypothetical protein